jgi:hypothetical protein
MTNIGQSSLLIGHLFFKERFVSNDLAFVQIRNGFIAAAMPNSFFIRSLALVTPKRVLKEG